MPAETALDIEVLELLNSCFESFFGIRSLEVRIAILPSRTETLARGLLRTFAQCTYSFSKMQAEKYYA
jgi:hypothetical protein